MIRFYSGLPTLKQASKVMYIRGYTEALEFYTGTRVVPDASYLPGIPKSLEDYFYSVGFPCYFVPQFLKQSCYGFTLKGKEKRTPSFSTRLNCLHLDTLNKGDTVWLVEGIKDSYLPLYDGQKVLPMDTSVPSESIMQYLINLKCSVVYIPDNDDKRTRHLTAFFKKLSNLKLEDSKFTWAAIEGVEDFGDYFKPECSVLAVEAYKRIREGVKQWLDN